MDLHIVTFIIEVNEILHSWDTEIHTKEYDLRIKLNLEQHQITELGEDTPNTNKYIEYWFTPKVLNSDLLYLVYHPDRGFSFLTTRVVVRKEQSLQAPVKFRYQHHHLENITPLV